MNVVDHIIKDANIGIEIATKRIETAQGLFQDAHDEGNMVAVSHAKEAIDFASLAVTSYHEAVIQGKDEDRLDSLNRGSWQLRRCEEMLTKARASLNRSEGDR